MRTIYLFLLLLAAALPAQEPVPNMSEKGAAPLPKSTQTSSFPPHGGGGGGATRAVVVGISDYQHNGIPDLQYAHKDAEAFAARLSSPAGGALSGTVKDPFLDPLRHLPEFQA